MLTRIGKKRKVKTASQISTRSWLKIVKTGIICQFVLWSGATKKVSTNLGYENEDNDEPDVGEDGGGGGDDEDREVFDPPSLAVRDSRDADRRDGKQVERGRPAVWESGSNFVSKISNLVEKRSQFVSIL